jgi:hypothetical protein
MMAEYSLDKDVQHNGHYEVHRSDCSIILQPENRVYLGEHISCHDAVKQAESLYMKAQGVCIAAPSVMTMVVSYFRVIFCLSR